MALIDLVVLIVLIIFGVIGYYKGFVKIVGYFAAVIFGSFAAYKYYGPLAEGYINFFERKFINEIISGIIIFLVCAVAVKLITRFLHKVASFSLIGWFNKFCGIIAGIATGALILGIILLPLAHQKKINNYFEKDTFLVKYIVGFNGYIYNQLKGLF